MPITSEMWLIRRVPSTRRWIWTSRSNALAICSRIARWGSSTPAVITSVSSRASASRGEFAWIVVSEPSWPVFIAWSMSRVSAPRTSPTMMRSGRMRRALRTSSRILISPLPSMFAGRDSSVITCSCWSCSSAASSIVTMRSSSGMNAETALSVVVLPVPVPPEMRMFSLPLHTGAEELRRARRQRAERDQVVDRVRVARELADRQRRAVERERRDDRVDAAAVGKAGIDHRRDSSMRRPTCETILSMMRIRCASSTKRTGVRSILPGALDVDAVAGR